MRIWNFTIFTEYPTNYSENNFYLINIHFPFHSKLPQYFEHTESVDKHTKCISMRTMPQSNEFYSDWFIQWLSGFAAILRCQKYKYIFIFYENKMDWWGNLERSCFSCINYIFERLGNWIPFYECLFEQTMLFYSKQ